MDLKMEENIILTKVKSSSIGCSINDLREILNIPILPVIKRLKKKGLIRVDKPSSTCPYTRFKATNKVFYQ